MIFLQSFGFDIANNGRFKELSNGLLLMIDEETPDFVDGSHGGKSVMARVRVMSRVTLYECDLKTRTDFTVRMVKLGPLGVLLIQIRCDQATLNNKESILLLTHI